MPRNPLALVENQVVEELMRNVFRELAFLYSGEGGLPDEIFRLLNNGEVPVHELAMELKRRLDAMVQPRNVTDPDCRTFL